MRRIPRKTLTQQLEAAEPFGAALVLIGIRGIRFHVLTFNLHLTWNYINAIIHKLYPN